MQKANNWKVLTVAQKGYSRGPRTLSQDDREFLLRPQTIDLMQTWTLAKRCRYMNLEQERLGNPEQKPPLTTVTLARFYRNFGLRWVSPGFSLNSSKHHSPEELFIERKKWAEEMVEILKRKNKVIYVSALITLIPMQVDSTTI